MYDRRAIALDCRGCKRANAELHCESRGAGDPNFGANPPLCGGGAGSFRASPSANPVGRRRSCSVCAPLSAWTYIRPSRIRFSSASPRRWSRLPARCRDRRRRRAPACRLLHLPGRRAASARRRRLSRLRCRTRSSRRTAAPRSRRPRRRTPSRTRSTPPTGSPTSRTATAAATAASSTRATTARARVSYALRGGGLLKRPLHSSAFMRWGEAGRGQWITVYTNPGHAYVVIAGLRFDTSGPGRARPALAQERPLQPRLHGAPPRRASSGVSGVSSRPSVGEETTTSSPSCSQTRGSRTLPTPEGVPVETMSPGSSVIRRERWDDQRRDREDQVAGVGRLHRLAVQRERDLDRVVGAGLVGRHERGPAGRGAVEDLARHPLRRCELQVARREVVEEHVARRGAPARPLRGPRAPGARSRTRPRPRSRPSRSPRAASPRRRPA